MTDTEIKARKLELKRQYFQIRGIDRMDRIEKGILLGIRQRYEKRMNETFDLQLSRKLDCIDYLIEEN